MTSPPGDAPTCGRDCSPDLEIGPLLGEGADLVLAMAKGLFVNGQSSARVVARTERLASRCGLKAHLFPRWGDLNLRIETGDEQRIWIAEATPSGVDMTRVAGLSHIAGQIMEGRLAGPQAHAAIAVAARTPPAPVWLFTLAAAGGAAALSVIFGVEHPAAVMLIVLSAGAGALLRRWLAQVSTNPYLQPFAAALLAGVIGAVAERLQLSSSLRLIAVCPCMILVPGPHVLNGGLDLLQGHVPLGAARLVFATLVTMAIACGLILGLAILGVDLPVDPVGHTVPLWADVAAAGVAVAAYGVFFNMPARMLPWPVAIGAMAHALRWLVIAGFGFSPAGAAFTACAAVGFVMAIVANRLHVPFAAAGFAAVVSMMPGVFLFRMASGLAQIATAGAGAALLSDTITDGVTAATVILAMIIGLLVPKLVIDTGLKSGQGGASP